MKHIMNVVLKKNGYVHYKSNSFLFKDKYDIFYLNQNSLKELLKNNNFLRCSEPKAFVDTSDKGAFLNKICFIK